MYLQYYQCGKVSGRAGVCALAAHILGGKLRVIGVHRMDAYVLDPNASPMKPVGQKRKAAEAAIGKIEEYLQMNDSEAGPEV